jgi:hypothetical protein
MCKLNNQIMIIGVIVVISLLIIFKNDIMRLFSPSVEKFYQCQSVPTGAQVTFDNFEFNL